VRLGDAFPGVAAEALAAIAEACRDAALLHFEYRGRDGEWGARVAEPYRLVHTSSRWYLLAYDLERRDWRTFRVDRVGPGPRLGRRFQPRPLPSGDVAAYVSQAISTDVYRYRAKITIDAPARAVAERLSGVAGRIEELDAERCLVHTGANSLEALAFYLGFIGFDFEVHEPAELADYLRRFAARLARAAGRAAG
jgi:predicted DNA-binding transcriptional regulator YafY